jgi:uncharacterized protein YutD
MAKRSLADADSIREQSRKIVAEAQSIVEDLQKQGFQHFDFQPAHAGVLVRLYQRVGIASYRKARVRGLLKERHRLVDPRLLP